MIETTAVETVTGAGIRVGSDMSAPGVYIALTNPVHSGLIEKVVGKKSIKREKAYRTYFQRFQMEMGWLSRGIAGQCKGRFSETQGLLLEQSAMITLAQHNLFSGN